MSKHLVITALGKDRPGIVNDLTQAILDCECNIADSSMMVLGGEFSIMLLVTGKWNTIARLEETLPNLQDKLELTLHFKRTENRQYGDNLLPYAVDVISIDHPGIVHHLANFFSTRKINIEELSTSSYSAAHTGTQMFAAHLEVGIPSETSIAELRDEFMEFCDSMNLDAVIEPLKN